MAYNLEQIALPVAVLGNQTDPADPGAAAIHFQTLIDTMAENLPCKGWVRLSVDLAERIWGENMPLLDPSEPLFAVHQSTTMTIYIDQKLHANTARLE
jgi:hypothetical protein